MNKDTGKLEALLRVENLTVGIRRGKREYIAAEDVSFELRSGGTLGIVGESGCGKSVVCLSVLRLAAPNIRIASGEVFFEGTPLTKLPDRAFDTLRGRAFSMIFQDSISGLNPLMRVGAQVAEALEVRDRGRGGAAGTDARRREVRELLERVRLSDAARCARSYPHELSGGQRQRVMIAIAVAAGPRLLIADEPTTALDVSTQRDILALLREMRERDGMSLIMVSHDVGVIREMCDEALVMYCGKTVEAGRAADVLSDPLHPYTGGLVRSAAVAGFRGRPLSSIKGVVASLERRNPDGGCVFAERCDRRCPRRGEPPPLVPTVGRLCRCHMATGGN